MAALPTEPARVPAARLQTRSSGQAEAPHWEVSQDFQLFYTLSGGRKKKRHFAYAAEKEENSFQRHSLTVCRRKLLFPNKRASTAGSKVYGTKKEVTDKIQPSSHLA